jgi:hypothetical protein
VKFIDRVEQAIARIARGPLGHAKVNWSVFPMRFGTRLIQKKL